jgi:hypothetical protein
MNVRRSLVVAVGAWTVVASCIAASAPPARAGTYKLYSCNVPKRPTPLPSTAPWRAELDGLHTFEFNDCVSGGSFGIGLNIRFMRAFSAASLALTRPETGPQAAIGIVRYRTWITAELSGQGAPAFVDEGGAFGPPGGATPEDDPWVSEPFSPTNPSARIRLRCTAGDCSLDSGRPLQVRGVEVDLYEDVPPAVTIEGGTLASGGRASARSTISFSATDGESGVARVEALIGDLVVAGEQLDGNAELCAHTGWNACPVRHAGDLVVDTSQVPPGEYPVALRVIDAAGNRRLVTAPQRVMIGMGAVAGPPVELAATLPRSRATYTTNFGRSVRVRGRLSAGGRSLARRSVTVVEKFARGGRRVRTIITGGDGRFAYVASGKKPSRSIELQYFARAGDPVPVATRRLRLRVRASSTFRLSLHGVLVRYSGQVVSKPLPRGGKRIFIQGRAAGGAWRRFAALRTDSTGRFSGRYRLRVRRPGVTLQFRVEIPKQSGYPFVARTGPAVTRVVR